MPNLVDRVGHGIFCWNGSERRGDRYGAFVVGYAPYEGNERVAAHLDIAALRPLVGKRVHVHVAVVKTRQSGHLGDLFHGWIPSTPNEGEIVDLGVGMLGLEDAGWDSLTAVVLEPEDGRTTFWIDPRKFYRLHDQTVDVMIVETDEPFSPAPDFTAALAEETVDDGDGGFQAKTKRNSAFRVEPDIERLGGGTFIVVPPTGLERGRRRKIR